MNIYSTSTTTGGRNPADCWAPLKSPVGRARARDARLSPEDQARLREERAAQEALDAIERAAQEALDAIERDVQAARDAALYADSLTTGRRPPREGYAPIRLNRHVSRTPRGDYSQTTGGHPPAECRAPQRRQKPSWVRCL